MKFEAKTPLKKLYLGLLDALGLVVNDDGVIESSGNSTYKPMTADGLVWLWPDHAVTKPADGRFIVFNPANEIGAQAPFMEEIIKRMETRLNVRFLSLMTECFAAASDPERKTGSNGYITLCRALPEITPTMNVLMGKLLQKWTSTFRDDKRFHVLALASRSSATIGTETFPRTALLRSPVYNFFMESDGRTANENFSFGGVYKFLGVSCKKGEMETMRNFWEYVFPTINQATQKVSKNTTTTRWLLGTRNNFGNAFFSVVRLYAQAITRIREVADSLGNEYKDHPLDFSVEWINDIAPAMEAKQEVMGMPTPTNLGTTAVVAPNPLAKPQPVTTAMGQVSQPKPAGKVNLLDLIKQGSPAVGDTTTTGGSAGRIVRVDGAAFLVVDDRAVPIGGGGAIAASSVAQPAIKMTGTPEIRGDGNYYAAFSDGLLYRVEFVGGAWARANQQQQFGGGFGGGGAGVFERGRGGGGQQQNSGGLFGRNGSVFAQQQVDPLTSMFRR